MPSLINEEDIKAGILPFASDLGEGTWSLYEKIITQKKESRPHQPRILDHMKI